jgi:hypothetical protein
MVSSSFKHRFGTHVSAGQQWTVEMDVKNLLFDDTLYNSYNRR